MYITYNFLSYHLSNGYQNVSRENLRVNFHKFTVLSESVLNLYNQVVDRLMLKTLIEETKK